ncbi:uracil-DNA glycosylase-like protein [Xylariaceae sp. FL1019]|nr:uracil-DNA glycosylase-like protein [Xylariaceae sp. FL1019]
MSSSQKRKSDVNGTDTNKKAKTNGSITSFFGPPKTTAKSNGAPSSSAPEPATPKFNKEAWVATLTPDQKKHLQLEINTLHESWLVHLKDEIVKPEFINLKKFLESEIKNGTTIFPPSEDVYSWSRHTPFNTVRAVIIGQDPYHNHNQAHGLCFSVRPPTPAPPSLKNMYKCLKIDYPSFVPPPANGGLLTPWAERGVLMLNTCLTVRAHFANSHQKKGWEAFTQKVIDLVAAKRTRGVVFLAWGSPAATRVVKVDKSRHLVLKSVHPSPLSAMRGFFECGHFRKTNEWLVQRYGVEGQIDWNLNRDGKPTVIGGGETGEKNGEEKKGEKKAEDEVKEGEIDEDAEEAEKEMEKLEVKTVATKGEVDEQTKEEINDMLEKLGEDGDEDGEEYV